VRERERERERERRSVTYDTALAALTRVRDSGVEVRTSWYWMVAAKILALGFRPGESGGSILAHAV